MRHHCLTALLVLLALVELGVAVLPTCCTAHGTPGCLDSGIQSCVCAYNEACCSEAWTQDCVDAVGSQGCGTCSAGPCCLPHSSSGCVDRSTSSCVCAADSTCCTGEWTDSCVQLAVDCGGCELSFNNSTSCCAAHGSPGCDNSATAACVCAQDVYCCSVQWDDSCVQRALSSCLLPSWTVEKPLLGPQAALGTAAIEDIIYTLAGDSDDFECTAYNTTSSNSTLIHSMTYRGYPGVVAHEGLLYMIGGSHSGYSDQVDIYDPVSDTWSSGTPMPEGRDDFGCAINGGYIYVAGGVTSKTYSSHDFLRYSISGDSWSSLDNMPIGISGLRAAVVNNVFYAIGGGYTKDVNAYDIGTGQWYSVAPLNKTRSQGAASALGGLIYATGGYDGAGHKLSSIEVYDPVTDTWTFGPDMPDERQSHSSSVVGNSLYVIGGFNSSVVPQDTVWRMPGPGNPCV